MADIIIELVGWIGAFFIVSAYFLLTKRKIKAKSIKYQLPNLIGSVMVAINAYFNMAFPSMVINLIWIMIAIWGIEQYFEE